MELTRVLIRLKIAVENLVKASVSEIAVLLSKFTLKTDKGYKVVIISADQARGLDFPTSSEIEANGGVFLIVGQMP